jgi:glucosamine--fructose-6-phosphate aminotransferase (isomerizing)
MCGIFAYIGPRKDAAQITLEGLKVLEYRGYDSWGIAIKDKTGKIALEKHVGKIGEASTTLPPASIAIGHTRWATHGGVTDANAHPHTNSARSIAVVHNGIVENYQQIKTTLLSKGHQFVSETDTEVIAHLLDQEHKDDSFVNTVMLSFTGLAGSNAILVLDAKSETIVACRNGSPLVVGIGRGEYLLASDVTALLPYTRNVYFLQDGETVELSAMGARLYDTVRRKEKVLKTEKIEWTVETAQKDGYPHYMLKEILEQVKTIPKASQISTDTCAKLAKLIAAADRVVLTGCGTAYHCCLLSQYYFAQAGIDTRAIAANEFPPFANMIGKNSIVFAVSQSGETADTLIAVKEAKARNAHIVAVVNARASSLERLADTVLPVGAGPEIAVVSTKAFTAQVMTMYMVANGCKPQPSQAIISPHELERKLAVWLIPQFLDSMRERAAQLLTTQDMYVIGKHVNYPAALEVALKVKEASYIHGEGFAAGELKHGVISLIQKGTPCIVLASDDETKPEILSSAIELKSRGGMIIGLAPFSSDVFDVHIETVDLGDLTPLASVIAGQLLGYYLSVGRGCDPDKPRNLAKSVTVK